LNGTFWSNNMNTSSRFNPVKVSILSKDITLATTDLTYQLFALDEPLDVKVSMPSSPFCGLRFVIINIGVYPFSVRDYLLEEGASIELQYSNTNWVIKKIAWI
jgi:hypothetical protein